MEGPRVSFPSAAQACVLFYVRLADLARETLPNSVHILEENIMTYRKAW